MCQYLSPLLSLSFILRLVANLCAYDQVFDKVCKYAQTWWYAEVLGFDRDMRPVVRGVLPPLRVDPILNTDAAMVMQKSESTQIPARQSHQDTAQVPMIDTSFRDLLVFNLWT